jgi:hypothetical protein
MKNKRFGKVHAIIPDVQVRPGMDVKFLTAVGNYIADKKPDTIVCIGDFADMPSLNSHGKLKELEGKRYVSDIAATKTAMAALLKPIKAVKDYSPKMVLTLGNHEARIDREAAEQPKLVGTISTKDLGYEEAGWKVVPFLQPISIDGIAYCHYFISGAYGRPVSSASALLRRVKGSAVMGHVQSFDLAIHPYTGNLGMFCGTCNLVNEDYLTPQGNFYRRHIVFLHEVRNGICDPMLVSLKFLKARYA